ncbi:peptidoglycan-binding protein [Streptomyces sp. McG3]|uniref:peptidoglycan-binding domain-containing protein n=1 Tax=Streptomyces sp. McG3 TaxID=2725483 RepID=UPI001BEC5BB5|nr:peptidoglycan-binding domain-containing protein [Streptomyces sp. McG3]MBT2896656.1 hypothetical protein [Streptomyces sp. McG3]
MTEQPRGTRLPSPSAEPLRFGATGAAVEELQLRLTQLSAYQGPIDAEYGIDLALAVGQYQRTRKIETDRPGHYGPGTRARLEAETQSPHPQLQDDGAAGNDQRSGE